MSASRRDHDTARVKRLARSVARSRWPRIVVVLVIGSLLSVLLFWALARTEASQTALDFRRDAGDRIAAFKVSLTHGLDSLGAVDALFASSSDVSRDGFRAFTGEHLLEEPGVTVLGWAPRVVVEDRSEFEASVRAETSDGPGVEQAVADYRIWEVVSERPAPVASRSEYFPVLYAEPSTVGRHIFGFDVVSDEVQGDALRRARDAQRMAASQRASLGPGSDSGFGTVIFRPVYDEMRTSEFGQSERDLRGFIFGMFSVAEILEHALEGLEPRGIDIAIHDLSALRNQSLLSFHRSNGHPEVAVPWSVDEALVPTGLGIGETVVVGDREWMISCQPGIAYISSRRTAIPLLALIGGLLLTAIAAGMLLAMMKREAESRLYAADLLTAKGELESEALQRESARADLAASEERFRMAFGNAPIGGASVDLQGNFLQVNPALCHLLGYEERELLGLSIADVVHPDDQEDENAQMARVLKGDVEAAQYVERLRRRDGSHVWAELNVSVVRDESGRPLYFVGQQQDITERREISERLRQARETQEQILDSLPLNVFLKDAEGRLRFINAEGLRLLGREREDVVGKTDFELFPHHIAEEHREVDLKVLASGETATVEQRLEIDGHSVPYLAGKTVINVEGYEEPHLLGFSIDMTPIKEAEEALSRSEYRFRQLVENMSSGVAVYQAVDDGADFVFRDYNRAAEKMDGMSREDILGKRLTEVFPGAEEMGLLGLFRGVWRTGDPGEMPVSQYHDERLEGWRENHAYRLPSGEVVAIFDDITERKRLEADLLHAQKMEAIGRLAGGVAHDFNNLLQVVSGNTDLLLSGVADEEERTRMLREVHEQAQRGTHLAKRLLVFSRRERYAPAPADLREVVQGAETLVRRLLKENIELIIEPHDQPLPIEADRGQLEQVLMNLVVNASDAMPEGGRLEIRHGTDGTEDVFFSVTDTGPGVSEDTLEKIFDPYFTTKPAAQGTGLGLSVVHGIVSLHGGRIEVDNRPGKGAEFKVTLPRNDVAAPVSKPEASTDAVVPSQGERVLVVEDQELVRRTIETMLTSLGYSVTSAADGASARECVTNQQFDLLVSDIVLPDTTGVELAHEFRADRSDLGVLLVSGYAEESVRERGAEFRFLQKPFRLDDLAKQAASALAERPKRSA